MTESIKIAYESNGKKIACIVRQAQAGFIVTLRCGKLIKLLHMPW